MATVSLTGDYGEGCQEQRVDAEMIDVLREESAKNTKVARLTIYREVRDPKTYLGNRIRQRIS